MLLVGRCSIELQLQGKGVHPDETDIELEDCKAARGTNCNTEDGKGEELDHDGVISFVYH